MSTKPGTFDLWVKREDARRESLELERKRMLERLFAWLEEHAAGFGLDQLVVFGSITKPYRFGPSSDIDIAAVGVHAGIHTALALAIERCFSRDVDIVDLDECRFSHWISQEGVWWKRP